MGLFQGEDGRFERFRVEQGDRAPAVEPASGLAGIDQEGAVPLFDERAMGVPEDEDIARVGREIAVDRAVEMADDEPEPGVGEEMGRFLDLAQAFEGLQEAGLLAVAVAVDRLDRGGELPQLQGRERGHEIAGVDDQVAAGVVEQADGPADGGQVVVGVGDDADHGSSLKGPL